jgi:2-polyprenyl-3-methyl-5-hydroxy-6-metoxy-1,4-benzoquinol methylase
MALVAEIKDYQKGGLQKSEYSPDEVVTVSCPLCASAESTRIFTEHGSIGISRCASCFLIYANPRIKSPEQVYWGDGDVYYEESRLIFEGKASHHRDPNYLEELRLIEQYKKGRRILDVGCNMGMLLRLAMRRGWEAVGAEPSPSLSKLALKHGFKVYNCFLDQLPEAEAASFDVVAFSDVFEHICEPREFLASAGRFMAPDGILYVKVPNARWNLFKQKMLAVRGRVPKQGVWDSYEHVVHYTDKTLRQMLESSGFKVLQITIAKPIQIPVWHEYVGHYYQYQSPWVMDWKRRLGRAVFHWLSWPEWLVRFGSIGYFAPNIVAVAKKAERG